ncbi:MAG: ParB/RepB/Spo0J family partition protein [Acidobacteriota bacterium]
MKRKVLGKGLAALLPEAPELTASRAGRIDRAEGGGPSWAEEVDVARIDPNPFQPRQRLERGKIQELARSLARKGVMQPLVVRRVGSRYQLVAGERRWRAARLAGLARVPVVVREVREEELLELALIENIQREDLNPIEEAAAYRRMVSELGLSQEQIAERVGKDRSTVANLVRLLRLPTLVRDMIARGKLSPGHARPLLALPGTDAQIRIARQVERRGLSARDVERRVRAVVGASHKKAGTSEKKLPPSDANTRAAEERLRAALGTRVRIHRRGKSGCLEIEFYSEDDLNRLYELLLRGAKARGSSVN